MKNFFLLFVFIPVILIFGANGHPGGYPLYALLMLWYALEYFPLMYQKACRDSLYTIHGQYVDEIHRLQGDSMQDMARKIAKVQHSSDLFFESR